MFAVSAWTAPTLVAGAGYMCKSCPYGPMDKAPAYGAGDSGFESRYGLSFFFFLLLWFSSFPGLGSKHWVHRGAGGGRARPRPRTLHRELVFVFTSNDTKLSFPGWRNWQRARLLTGRLRVRASLWEITFWIFSFLFFSFLFFSFLFGRYKRSTPTLLFRAG